MVSVATLAALFLLSSPHWLAGIEGNLIDSQNVFGWQKPKRVASIDGRRSHSHHVSTSSPAPQSPLQRSENVFGWQPKDSPTKDHKKYNNRRGRNDNDGRERTIIHASNPHKSERDDEEGRPGKHLNLHPPNIKLEPRKKELWLPWPLGALRNDFNRFAAEHNNNGNNARQEWHPRDSAQQQQLRNYYSDEGYRSEGRGVFDQGRDWADKMLRRGSNMLPFPMFHQQGENAATEQQVESQSSYWVKDTTTPMATASATRKKNQLGGGKNHNGLIRGGESKDADQNKGLDKDVLCRYLKLQASIRMRQLGYVGSDFSVHLPPAAPILLFYYLLPSKKDPIRRLVKYTVTGAALSWMHSEATKYRRFSPLPIMKGMNVRQPNLPPFLPEEMVWEEGEEEPNNAAAEKKDDSIGKKGKSRSSKAKEETAPREEAVEESSTGHHWDPFQSFGTVSSAYRTWLEGYTLRNKQSYRQRRARAQEQLLALQKSASNATASAPSSKSAIANNGATGYALITGASGGIGRALAVELARYQIPLILVARDLTRLRAVAKDIETYYDVPCRILRADLSAPDAAERIHAATTSAGLDVDILVNNAGVCAHGDFIEGDDEDAARMLQVNVGSSTQLCRLYGRDMKERRRGRILFVSSMSGVLPGCPSVGVYAATKAFGKSFASSLGREMERYGVGVTCLLPGAVKDTSFASKSEVEDAVCFHFPGYAASPELVAGEGVKALMLGYPESYPGWQNRVFVKTFLPMLPPRMSIIIGEWAWNPWQWGDVMPQRPGLNRRRDGLVEDSAAGDKTLPSPPALSPPATTWKFRLPSASSNQMQLPEVSKATATVDSSDVSSKPTAIQFVDPIQDAAPANATISTNDVPESVGQKLVDPNAESERYPPTLEKNDRINSAVDGGTIITGDDQSGQRKESNEEDALALPTSPPDPLVLPPASPQEPSDSQTSKAPALFGFFEKDKKAPSDSDPNEAGKSSESNTDVSGGAVESTPSSESGILPSMMDKKEYDFRDRRLDY